ncbi:MAG: DUF4912 domain-containing protein [Myxococcota bacterium]
MSNDDRSRRVWRLLERGWTTARAFRDRLEQVREVVDEARVRISDEVVSRLSGTPVRTRSDPPRSEPWDASPYPPASDESLREEVSSAADAVSTDAVIAEANRAAPAANDGQHNVPGEVPPTGPITPAGPYEDEVLPVAEAVDAPAASGHDMVPKTPSGVSDLPGLLADADVPVPPPVNDEAEAEIDTAFNVLFTDSALPTRMEGNGTGDIESTDIVDPIAANLKAPEEDLAGMTVARRGAEPSTPSGPVFSPDLPGAWPPPPPAVAAAPESLFSSESMLFGASSDASAAPISSAAASPKPEVVQEAAVPTEANAYAATPTEADAAAAAPTEAEEDEASTPLVALARDAEWLFVYWELEDMPLDADASVLLRVVRVDDDQLVHQSSASLPTSRRYIRVPFADTAYRAELWVRTAEDEALVSQSREATTPPARPQTEAPATTRMMSTSAHQGVLNAAWDLSRVPSLPPEPTMSDVQTESIRSVPSESSVFDTAQENGISPPPASASKGIDAGGSEVRLAADASRRSGEDFQYPVSTDHLSSSDGLGSEARLFDGSGFGSEPRFGAKES